MCAAAEATIRAHDFATVADTMPVSFCALPAHAMLTRTRHVRQPPAICQ